MSASKKSKQPLFNYDDILMDRLGRMFRVVDKNAESFNYGPSYPMLSVETLDGRDSCLGSATLKSCMNLGSKAETKFTFLAIQSIHKRLNVLSKL